MGKLRRIFVNERHREDNGVLLWILLGVLYEQLDNWKLYWRRDVHLDSWSAVLPEPQRHYDSWSARLHADSQSN